MEFPNQPEHADAPEATDTVDIAVLPTMGDLDRLASDLDQVDATLAALDRDVAGPDGPQGFSGQTA